MARTAGSRNRDYEQKRGLILVALQKRLREADAARLSLNEMADAADVSVSSLRHHLGTRSEILAAVMAEQGKLGAPYLARVRAEPEQPLDVSVRQTMRAMLQGLNFGLGELLANGLSMSLRDPVAGPSFLEHFLEPMLSSLEVRLAAHARRGEMIETDYRVAALGLVAPLVLASLHQTALCGHSVRPLSLPALVEEQVNVFLRAYATPRNPPVTPPD